MEGKEKTLMFKNAVFFVTLLTLVTISVSSVKAHAPGVVLEALTLTPPTIDGVMASGEWDDADTINFTSTNPSPWDKAHTLYIMNDKDNLYLAVKRYDETPGEFGDWITFTFDNDNDGLIETGDDRIKLLVVSWAPLPGRFEDWYYVGAIPSGESEEDTDGSGAAGIDGNYTIFEISHPLDSGDYGQDFSLSPGDTVGFNIDSYDGSHDLGAWPAPWPSTWNSGIASQFGDIIVAGWTTPTIYSWWATTTPTIDGAISSANEWTDAREVALQWIDTTGSTVTPPTGVYAFFKNDADYLYVLYDIDVVPSYGSVDYGVEARMSFDTGHDTLWTKGEEHDFTILHSYFTNTTTTYHDVSNGTIKNDYPWPGYLWLDLSPHCSPFNTSQPQHTGLVAALGYGSTPKDPRTHPIVEWRIPLALLGAYPGDTIGYAMAGPNEVPGATDTIGSPHGVEIFEVAGWFYAQWPELYSGNGSRPLDKYGDLVLAPQGFVIPEYWLGPLLGLVGMFAAFGTFYLFRRKRFHL